MMFGQPRALEQRDRPLGIAQAQTQGFVQVSGTRQPFIEAAQGRIEIGSNQPVHDATRKVPADGDLQSRRFKDLTGRYKRFRERTGLANKLDQGSGLGLTESEARKSDDVTPFRTTGFARVDTQAFGTQFDRDKQGCAGSCLLRPIRVAGTLTNHDPAIALRVRLGDERMRIRKRGAGPGLNDSISCHETQAPNIF